jgi:hypothetical protein
MVPKARHPSGFSVERGADPPATSPLDTGFHACEKAREKARGTPRVIPGLSAREEVRVREYLARTKPNSDDAAVGRDLLELCFAAVERLRHERKALRAALRALVVTIDGQLCYRFPSTESAARVPTPVLEVLHPLLSRVRRSGVADRRRAVGPGRAPPHNDSCP